QLDRLENHAVRLRRRLRINPGTVLFIDLECLGFWRQTCGFALCNCLLQCLSAELGDVVGPRWPFSGLKASSHTIDETRSPIRSSAPDPGQPPYECTTRQTSLRSSHFTTLTMSVMWVSRLMSLLRRCERSPTPVSVGANTLWPFS